MQLFLEDFAVDDLLDDDVVLSAPLLEGRCNRLDQWRGERLGTIYGDRIKLRQCLLNLMSNAAKFSERGVITLTARRESNALLFEVSDTDIGLTDTQLGRLFESYTQADASIGSRYGGTGLGLALTSRFCELMGGTVIASGQPGMGSRLS